MGENLEDVFSTMGENLEDVFFYDGGEPGGCVFLRSDWGERGRMCFSILGYTRTLLVLLLVLFL
jgi:hypothetical protein